MSGIAEMHTNNPDSLAVTISYNITVELLWVKVWACALELLLEESSWVYGESVLIIRSKCMNIMTTKIIMLQDTV